MRRKLRYATIVVPLEENDRAAAEGEGEGFLRLHHHKGSDEILGATLVAEQAGETSSALALALQQGLGLADLAEIVPASPTRAEVLRRAADAWRRQRLTPFRRRLLSLRFHRHERTALRRLASSAARLTSASARASISRGA